MAVKHEFIVYGEPRGKGRPRFTMKGHTFTDALTQEYEKRVKHAWNETGFEKLDKQPTTVLINAYFAVAESLPKKKKMAMFGTECLKKPDGDNIGKIILDSLNGLAWEDDSQIDTLLVTKRYVSDNSVMPHVRVTIIGEQHECEDR